MSQEQQKALLEKRNKANADARAIVDAAIEAERALSAEEQEQIRKFDEDYASWNTQLEDVRKRDERDTEIRSFVADHPELQPDTPEQRGAGEDVADVIRQLARGEIRSHEFQKRAITTSSTGAPVPQDFYSQIVTLARASGPMLDPSVVQLWESTNGRPLPIPTQASYSSGTAVTEGSGIGESNPTFNAMTTTTLNGFSLKFLMKVSNEMLADEGADLQGFLASQAGDALGYAANAWLTTGTGTVQPTGIVTAAGSGVTGGTGVSGAFTTDKIIDLIYSLNKAVRSRAGFGVMGGTPATAAVRKLQDGAGAYIWQPSLQLGQPDRILGYRYFENPAMADPATTVKSVVAGDFKSYFVRTVGGIKVAQSADFAFDEDMVTFRCILRLDGLLTQASHVKYFKGGAS